MHNAGDERVDLAARATGDRQGRTRPGRGDRIAAEDADHRVHTCHRDEFGLRVGPKVGRGLPLGGGERESPGDEHDVAVADDRDAQAGEQEHLDVLERHLGQLRHGQPRRDLAHHRHPI